MTPSASVPLATFVLSRWIFLRALGAVTLIAFLSLWTQIDALVGSRGLLPVEPYLDVVRERLGGDRFWKLPTLCWWAHDDASLRQACLVGMILSVMLIIGIAPRLTLLALWAVYLSLTVVGQQFLSFQWDTLLLETLFCAIWYAPLSFWPGLTSGRPPSAASRWLIWLLLFKLMFLSGATKWLSGDETWRDCTALAVHYQTQPLPNPLSWLAHHMPLAWHQFECIVMHLIELVVPWLIFGPRRLRHLAFVLLVALQIGIELTGNYGFFNLLSIVLCLPLLDDALLVSLFPLRWSTALAALREQTDGRQWWLQESRMGRLLRAIPPVLLMGVSGLAFMQELVRSQNSDKLPAVVTTPLELAERALLSWGEPHVLDPIRPFRTINGYGLFRVMTMERPEIVIEGSRDGVDWVEYSFRYKPGDVRRRPVVVAPHMPRLDWQMWFAALNPRGNEGWLTTLCQRLLEGEPGVLALLGDNPFPEAPPASIRLVYYRYRFTTPAEHAESGAWWQRERLGKLTPPLSLRNPPVETGSGDR